MITKTGGDLIERRTAIFSDCEKYRYLLKIVWDDTKPLCQFIGLNPSTADEMKDDPTLRRVKDFAKRWGCGGVLMTNAFAFRATDPKVMMRESNPLGGHCNNEVILKSAREAKIVVAAWGTHANFKASISGASFERSPGMDLKDMLVRNGILVQALGFTKNGHPKHPLYVAAKTKLVPFL